MCNSKDKPKYRILLVSSMPPAHSAGYGWDVIKALESAGHKVDFLTAYSFPHMRKNDIVLKKRKGRERLIYIVGRLLSNKRMRRLKNMMLRLYYKTLAPTCEKPNGILIVNPDESKPDVSNELLIGKIVNDYDAVIILFWQGMINSTSLVALYEKLNCPIIVDSPDMAPMTGGCQYFNTCRRFEHLCGCCPGLRSNDPNDKTHDNFLIKKQNYGFIKLIFRCNTWMKQFAEKSGLFIKNRIESISFILNEGEFAPTLKRGKVRKKLGLPCSKEDIVILVRSAKDYRKGSDYAVESLSAIVDIHPDLRQRLTVLTIGEDYVERMLADKRIRCVHLGLVGKSDLIKCYQAADYFMNCSVDDAGPSMVNQSILCGTPVICFDNGTACDVIHDGVSGFKCRTGDIGGLTRILQKAISVSPEDYAVLRQTTREMGLKYNSYRAYIDGFEQVMSDVVMKKSR